jgi:hypothetical protein
MTFIHFDKTANSDWSLRASSVIDISGIYRHGFKLARWGGMPLKLDGEPR